ncbi:uncharacterized protein LOC142632376 [Castanea sativa]|uniref:uncharacterized protein LOC142632376 n=1 Tax=Castanea sativa TaxID=21020 RepID=UPI003F650C41
MTIKLDMSKAYNRIEWDYLKALMLKMGFHKKWVDLIMAGISTVSYSVLVNGAPSGFIKPSRDDSLFFCNASLSECHIIMEILQAYEIASGQKINSDKSFILFSSNTPHSLREEIKQLFNANSNVPLEKYLGLPPIIGRGKMQAFEDIKSKVQSKLEGWKGKLLS